MLGVFKKTASTYAARIEPFGIEITIPKGERLLSSALTQGVKWPHRCKVGSCGTCKTLVLSRYCLNLFPWNIKDKYIGHSGLIHSK